MYVNFQNDTQIGITFNNQAEQVLLNIGFDKMSTEDKNSLIAVIAVKKGIPFTDITADYILNYHKSLKTAIINGDCENAIVTGFKSTNGHTYELSRDDQMNMLGQKDQLMADTTITTVQWKTVDGGMLDHTRDDWLNNVYLQAFSYKKEQLLKCDSLKVNIASATTNDAIVAIQW